MNQTDLLINKPKQTKMSTDNFQWTDKLVAEYGQFFHSCFNNPLKYMSKDILQEFKQSKTVSSKDYKIISFGSYTNKPVKWVLDENGLYKNNFGSCFTEDELLYPRGDGHHSVETGEMYIHSVKRLSDGEVFTIGDYVKQVEPYCDGHRWQIKEFSLKDTRCFTIGVNITCIKKVEDKNPILTTEDGVDIFEGHSKLIWKVFIQPTSFEKWTPYFSSVPNIPIDGEKYFSIEEAAMKYILENKPCLSVNDVMSFFKKSYQETSGLYPSHEAIRGGLIKLVTQNNIR